MDISLGTTFTAEEIFALDENGNTLLSQLAQKLNELGDRSLRDNGDGTYTIEENKPHVKSPQEEMWELKQYLSSTDYCVIKCMETGESMATLYPEIHAKRTDARQRINELEAIIS